MARIELISLAQNEPKQVGSPAKSGTDQNEMPAIITPEWVAQNEPKYPPKPESGWNAMHTYPQAYGRTLIASRAILMESGTEHSSLFAYVIH